MELPAYHAFYLDEQFKGAERNRSFMRYLESFRASAGEPCPVPDQLAATLRPYQAEGLRWMSALADRDLGGILADEMGLGKSVQLIAFLLARQSEARAVGPSLIVCPASLVYNWMAESSASPRPWTCALRWAPSASACASAPRRARETHAKASLPATGAAATC